ncbi:MAG: hypothetical protein KJZ78_06425 [Bryobacteraceae bacterium]|nr:hypothetical protein [Bryobacteraceae bacterium]
MALRSERLGACALLAECGHERLANGVTVVGKPHPSRKLRRILPTV